MKDVRAGLANRSETRLILIEAAARLLAEHGPGSVTTRAVAHAAAVQPPSLYRLFGDKDGLLDAVAEHVLALYVAQKMSESVDNSDDPIQALRAGWEMSIGFGLANPVIFGLLINPGRAIRSPAALAGVEVLRARVHRIAELGRLRVAERRAVETIQSAGIGALVTLLSMPAEDRDLKLADGLYDAVTQTILTDTPAPPKLSTVTDAVTFRTVVPHLENLTTAERALMSEWLDRATQN